MPISTIGTDGLAAANVTTAKIADANVTQAKLGTNVAGNGPAFSAYIGTNQSITTSVWTKAQFNTETFDTNSNYDTSLYRFTPTVAGYYLVNYTLAFISGAATGLYAGIYKNGSSFRYVVAYGGTNALDDWNVSGSNLVYMNGKLFTLPI